MSDGAHIGIGAERAIGTILGGEAQPTKDERRSPDQMRDWLLAATLNDATTYDGAARYASKLVLKYLSADPDRLSLPVENVYDDQYNVVTPGLYDRMKRDGIPIDDLGLTGFMWGWAVNAARYSLTAPPVPNPAILTINIPES